MNAIKPYMFWVICGILLLIEVVAMLIIVPTPPPNAPPTSAEAAQQFENLLKGEDGLVRLTERARATLNPAAIAEPIDPTQAETKLRNFIITNAWQAPLNREVSRRQDLLTDLRAGLAERSQTLSEPVSQQQDNLAWYTEYAQVTGRLLQELVQQKVLDPPTGTADRTAGTIYETDRSLRDRLAFITSSGEVDEFRDMARRTTLSRQFRIVERIAKVMAAVEVVPELNPRIHGRELKGVVEPTAQKVLIRRISFVRQEATRSPQAVVIRVELTGAPAALLAATRAVDAITQPLGVRLGARWSRISTLPSEAKHAVSDVPMDLSFDYLVLDFANLAGG